MKKFKSLASTYIRKIAILLVISTLSSTILCSCGDDKNSTQIETETYAETETATQKPNEAKDEKTERQNQDADPTEATPSEAETTVNLPSDEYLVDYPITVGDQKVYLKTPDGFNTIKNDPICVTVYESEDTENSPFISYTVNPFYSIEYYKEHTETGLFNDGAFTIELTEETCDNGITIVKAESKFEYVGSIICYLIEYVIDDNTTIQVYISDNPNIESILDFYRNTENVVVVY